MQNFYILDSIIIIFTTTDIIISINIIKVNIIYYYIKSYFTKRRFDFSLELFQRNNYFKSLIKKH